MDKDIWIIVPAYNEAKFLANFLEKLQKVTMNFVVIDDGSMDSTARIAKKYTKNVLIHKINLGKGAALKTGCDFAFNYLKAKSVVLIDGDDQHNPKEIDKFTEALKESEMVFGERKIDSKMPLIRIVANRFASVIIYLLFGKYISDIPSGYKAFNKNTYKKIKWNSKGYEVETEIACRVAKNKIEFKTILIETIYHEMDRGMNFLDVLFFAYKIFIWKFTL